MNSIKSEKEKEQLFNVLSEKLKEKSQSQGPSSISVRPARSIGKTRSIKPTGGIVGKVGGVKSFNGNIKDNE